MMLGTQDLDLRDFENSWSRYEFSNFAISEKLKKTENEKKK